MGVKNISHQQQNYMSNDKNEMTFFLWLLSKYSLTLAPRL